MDVGKEEQAGQLHRQVGHRREYRLGDERQRPLAADEQVGEDVDWALEVQERVEGVPGGVLHPVLGTNARGQGGVAHKAPFQLEQAFMQGRLPRAKLVVRARVFRIDARPRGEDEGERPQRVIRVLLHAAAHAAGVVGEDAANPAGVDRGGVRPHLCAERPEREVDVTADRPGSDAHAPAILLDGDAPEGARDVDQDPVADRLPRQTGAGGPEGER